MPPRKPPPTETARVLRRLREDSGLSAAKAGELAGLNQLCILPLRDRAYRALPRPRSSRSAASTTPTRMTATRCSPTPAKPTASTAASPPTATAPPVSNASTGSSNASRPASSPFIRPSSPACSKSTATCVPSPAPVTASRSHHAGTSMAMLAAMERRRGGQPSKGPACPAQGSRTRGTPQRPSGGGRATRNDAQRPRWRDLRGTDRRALPGSGGTEDGLRHTRAPALPGRGFASNYTSVSADPGPGA